MRSSAQGPCTASGSAAGPRSCHDPARIFDLTTRQNLTGERRPSAVLIREGRLSAAAGVATNVEAGAAAEAHTWLGSASRSTTERGDVRTVAGRGDDGTTSGLAGDDVTIALGAAEELTARRAGGGAVGLAGARDRGSSPRPPGIAVGGVTRSVGITTASRDELSAGGCVGKTAPPPGADFSGADTGADGVGAVPATWGWAESPPRFSVARGAATEPATDGCSGDGSAPESSDGIVAISGDRATRPDSTIIMATPIPKPPAMASVTATALRRALLVSRVCDLASNMLARSSSGPSAELG